MRRISLYPIPQQRIFSYEMSADAEILCLDSVDNKPVILVLETKEVPQGRRTFLLAEPGGKFEEPKGTKHKFVGLIHYRKSLDRQEESLLCLFEREVRILLG